MKRIATITTHAALNSGAVLQAYALQRYIEEQGCECDVLNYVPGHVDRNYNLIELPRDKQGVVRMAYQILNYSKRKKRKERFKEFRKEYIKTSGEELKTHGALVETANKYDVVVCGSDQIWNPAIHDFDEGYFLSFPEVKTKRVSYAASFGQDVVDEKVIPELKRRLSGITDFACREYTAQKLVKELTGKDAEMVLDPVFLMNEEEWKKILKPIETDKAYSLVCFLSNPGQSPFAVKKYAREKNEDVISIGFLPRDLKYGMKCEYALGPREFLGAIASADTILTNSFHCTAFAILMKKNFYTRISSDKGSRSNRMISLLTDLGLEDRLYVDKDADKLDFEKPIDYEQVQLRLNERIEASKRYINRILSEVVDD